jgi:hypothetical protein
MTGIGRPSRRRVLGSVGGALAATALDAIAPLPAAATDWDAGELVHVIPAVSHDRLLVKASFIRPLLQAPHLKIGMQSVRGTPSGTSSRFWRFEATGLAPATTYTLQLTDADGATLCDPWPLSTFPAPDARVDRLRVLAFTCGGGYDGVTIGDKTLFLEMGARRRLLARAISLRPDVVVSNGDMIYWDIATALNKGEPLARAARAAWERFGRPDFGRPMIGTDNELVLARIADDQIAGLYGTSLRSLPSFFLTDDHDLFENDEGTAEFVTLPPEPGRIAAERTIQAMYYPEFLPDTARPPALAGSSAADRGPGLSEAFGTLRFGRLVEGVLYDTKRFASRTGAQSGMVPHAVEQWLVERTTADDTVHFFHVPSTPFGWSAGKLGEWYPDSVTNDGRLGTAHPKPFWPEGWWLQHQRLIGALAAQGRRVPLVLQGDLHAVAYGILGRSGPLDLAGNPVHLVLTGPLGTGDVGFPSAYRGIRPSPSSRVSVQEVMAPLEQNGFTIIDFTPDAIQLRLYAWRPPQPTEAIDGLEPALTLELPRRS